MSFPTSTKWSVISLLFLTSVIVVPLTWANQESKKSLKDIPGLTYASESVASPTATPSPVAQNNAGVETSVGLAVTITTPTPEKPSELQEIVAYITYKFEPEGKDVVVRAINCFYSESGLRSDAVGQNSDAPKSRDFGVAQLNDYWHTLSEEQKTDYKANIDKAYDIYKGRGDNFSAWYGKLCN